MRQLKKLDFVMLGVAKHPNFNVETLCFVQGEHPFYSRVNNNTGKATQRQ
jgi:hypothetical protein